MLSVETQGIPFCLRAENAAGYRERAKQEIRLCAAQRKKAVVRVKPSKYNQVFDIAWANTQWKAFSRKTANCDSKRKLIKENAINSKLHSIFTLFEPEAPVTCLAQDLAAIK